MPPRRRLALAAVWLFAAFSLIYLPDIGHGFIKDDYGWIASSRADRLADAWRFFTDTPMGFYRPLVSLSFAVNGRLHGLRPLPYAHTNFGLVLLTAAGLWALGRRLGLRSGAALFAAAVWAFNVHGINMSVLWISGRTSILGTLFVVLAALAFSSSHRVIAGVFVLLALLSKEEPIALPIVFAAWTAIDLWGERPGARALATAIARRTWPSFAAVAVYLVLRAQTEALTPASAPDYYRLRAAAIGGNVLQYLDRALTFPAALLLLGALGLSRAALHITYDERRIAAKGAVWLALGFALTIMVPVRSSLYVLLPTVGSALAAGALGGAWYRAATRPRLLIAAALLLPVALLPVYRARNVRMKNEALLATHALETITARLADTPPPVRIVVVSAPGARPSFADAFGEQPAAAIRVVLPALGEVPVVSVPEPPARLPGDAMFRVEGSRLIAEH